MVKTKKNLSIWLIMEFPFQTIVCFSLVLVAGILEAISLAALLPLLGLIILEDSKQESYITEIFEQLFITIGLSPSLEGLLLVIVFSVILKSLFVAASSCLSGICATHAIQIFRRKLIEKTVDVEWLFFTSKKTGDFTAAMTTEVNKIGNAYIQTVRLLSNIIQVIVYVTLSFSIAPAISVGAITIGLILYILLQSFFKTARENGKRQTDLMKKFMSRIIENVTAMKTIKAMSLENSFEKFMREDIGNLFQLQKKIILNREVLKSIYEPTTVLVVAISIYLMLTNGNFSIHELITMALLFQRTVSKFSDLQINYHSIVKCEAAYWYVTDLAEVLGKEQERLGGIKAVFKSKIFFKDVSYSYKRDAVLKNVNFTLEKGSFVGILGPSGSGKTTLVDLLIGLLKPSSGSIFIDGTNLKDASLKEWRSIIGYVPQGAAIYNDTIKNNICLWSDDYTEKDINEVLELSGLTELVKQLPEGIHSSLGERGEKFSGGQVQRIALARALIRKPEILVMDETTSGIDLASRKIILNTIYSLRGSTTVIMITHQEDVVEGCDMKLVMGDISLSTS